MMLLSKTRSRSTREQTKFPAYIAKLRQCPCILCGDQAEASHLRFSDAKYGKVNKRDDKWCLPICPREHRLGPDAAHYRGEFAWWQAKGIDPLPIAKALWEARDDLEKMQGIAVSARTK